MNERTKATVWMRAALGVCVWTVLAGVADAERCTTQSAMTPADRSALADAARSVALKVQADDTAGLRSTLTPELTRDAAAFEYLAGSTSTKLAGSTAVVEQVYLLDASDLKKNADGSPAEAQFFCSLNKTTAEVQF